MSRTAEMLEEKLALVEAEIAKEVAEAEREVRENPPDPPTSPELELEIL